MGDGGGEFGHGNGGKTTADTDRIGKVAGNPGPQPIAGKAGMFAYSASSVPMPAFSSSRVTRRSKRRSASCMASC